MLVKPEQTTPTLSSPSQETQTLSAGKSAYAQTTPREVDKLRQELTQLLTCNWRESWVAPTENIAAESKAPEPSLTSRANFATSTLELRLTQPGKFSSQLELLNQRNHDKSQQEQASRLADSRLPQVVSVTPEFKVEEFEIGDEVWQKLKTWCAQVKHKQQEHEFALGACAVFVSSATAAKVFLQQAAQKLHPNQLQKLAQWGLWLTPGQKTAAALVQQLGALEPAVQAPRQLLAFANAKTALTHWLQHQQNLACKTQQTQVQPASRLLFLTSDVNKLSREAILPASTVDSEICRDFTQIELLPVLTHQVTVTDTAYTKALLDAYAEQIYQGRQNTTLRVVCGSVGLMLGFVQWFVELISDGKQSQFQSQTESQPNLPLYQPEHELALNSYSHSLPPSLSSLVASITSIEFLLLPSLTAQAWAEKLAAAPAGNQLLELAKYYVVSFGRLESIRS